MKGLLIILLTAFFTNAHSMNTEMLKSKSLVGKQFSALLGNLEKKLSKYKATTSGIKELAQDTEIRFIIMMVESLGKLYKKEDNFFENLRLDFKAFEDKVGEYRKWENVLKGAQLTPQRREEIKSYQDDGFEELRKEIRTMGWLRKNGMLSAYKMLISHPSKKFPKKIEKTSFAIKKLAKKLEKIQKENYEMSIFEEGNSLHELRRDLRWFGIQAKSLGGQITLGDLNSCPIKPLLKYTKIKQIVEHKYAQLNNYLGLKKTCKISPCLYYALVANVEKLGQMKDKIELELYSKDSFEDHTPVKYLQTADELYLKLKESKILKTLAGELRTCNE